MHWSRVHDPDWQPDTNQPVVWMRAEELEMNAECCMLGFYGSGIPLPVVLFKEAAANFNSFVLMSKV